MESKADLLVVGGGPAGLAVAIRARQAGLEVRVVDARRPPIDKACGEGLMPDGAALLAQLGVAIPEPLRHPFRGIRWIDGGLRVEAAFPAGPGIGVPRTVLHGAMVDRAADLGAELCWGVRALGLEDGAVVTSQGAMRARWLVAADGLRSPLRRAAGLEGRPARRARLGLTRHYAIAPWTDLVEVHWSDGGEAYVTPLGPRRVGVALLFEGRHAGFETMLAGFPLLADRLAGAPEADCGPAPAGAPPRACRHGAGPLAQRARRIVRGHLALVGDAAGTVDPITGEGLARAFHDAFAVVDAIGRGNLQRYVTAHRRIVRLPDMRTRWLLAIERWPGLRRGLLRALARNPELFRVLLAEHALARSRTPVRWTDWAPRLAWDLLRARCRMI